MSATNAKLLRQLNVCHRFVQRQNNSRCPPFWSHRFRRIPTGYLGTQRPEHLQYRYATYRCKMLNPICREYGSGPCRRTEPPDHVKTIVEHAGLVQTGANLIKPHASAGSFPAKCFGRLKLIWQPLLCQIDDGGLLDL